MQGNISEIGRQKRERERAAIRNGEAIEATADELSRQPYRTGRYAAGRGRMVFIISFQQKFSRTLHEQKPRARHHSSSS